MLMQIISYILIIQIICSLIFYLKKRRTSDLVDILNLFAFIIVAYFPAFFSYFVDDAPVTDFLIYASYVVCILLYLLYNYRRYKDYYK